MIDALVPLALLGSGLAAGILLSTALGIIPLMETFPADRYVYSHRYLWDRYDPFMPICFGLTVVADVVLAATAPDRVAQVMFAVTAVTLCCVMGISIVKQVPINRWVKSIDPESLPEDFERLDPRSRWRNWNLLRTVLSCAGFALNIAAASVL
ncbi:MULTISPECIES: anthrone oxygenase family protein [unclassified Nonomuraea]|uniref:anthrone oxygenase family protein n=1 Tax=unclassified Nonomuraea TaxID=2593643 RepID=UPI0035BFC90E